MTRLTVPKPLYLADPIADDGHRNHGQCIRELQELPFVGARVIRNVALASGVATEVAHGLGRAPIFVSVSCPRGTVTTVLETRDGVDQKRFVKLTAGATTTVDVLVL